jgi:hypothetical protein
MAHTTLTGALSASLSVPGSRLDPFPLPAPKIVAETLSTRYRVFVSGRGSGGRAASSISTVTVSTVVVTVSEALALEPAQPQNQGGKDARSLVGTCR